MASRVRPNSGRWLVVESLVLTAVLLAMYLAHAGRVMMHLDENHWIMTSNSWEPFVAAERSSPVWTESYLTLTAPPATRYIVGMGRALGGYGPDELPTPWTFGASVEQNAAAGAVPSDDLLWWSRLPMVLLAVVACLGSFWLMRGLFGAAAAYLALALLAFSPWLAAILVRAMAEAPLLCALLLAIAATVRVAVLAKRGAPLPAQLGWLAGAGASAGLAASLKLSGLTALAGIIAVWVIVAALEPTLKLPERVAIAIGGIELACVAAAIVLFVLNPYLDPDPLGRLVRLMQFRAEEMRGQLQLNATWPLKNSADRLRFIFSYVFEQAVVVRHPLAGAASLILCLVGLGYVLRLISAGLRQRVLDPAGAALIVALSAAGPMLATPLKWDRYMFLPVWFSALLIAVGITVCAQWLFGAVIKRRAWRAGTSLDETPGWQHPRPES